MFAVMIRSPEVPGFVHRCTIGPPATICPCVGESIRVTVVTTSDAVVVNTAVKSSSPSLPTAAWSTAVTRLPNDIWPDTRRPVWAKLAVMFTTNPTVVPPHVHAPLI